MILFTAVGLFYRPGEYNDASVNEILTGIEINFSVHWSLLLVPLLVIILAGRGMPALPALTLGALMGAGAALLCQPLRFISETGAVMTGTERYGTIIMTAYNGFSLDSGRDSLDALLSQGGLSGMYDTVALILSAMFFGGAMEATGLMRRIAGAILHNVRGAGSLISATVGSTILVNIFLAEQYLAIVLPGRMYRSEYQKRGLDARNLSRALEDGGTLTSVLVPWNTCGAFASSVLGISTLSYLPFCFFNLVSPVVALILAAMHIGIKTLDPETCAQASES